MPGEQTDTLLRALGDFRWHTVAELEAAGVESPIAVAGPLVNAEDYAPALIQVTTTPQGPAYRLNPVRWVRLDETSGEQIMSAP